MVTQSKISPVLQFVLLIAPIVLSSFFFIYAVVGLIIDGRDKVQWAVEAWDVSLMTAAMIIGFSVLVLILVVVRKLGLKNILTLSSIFHITLAICLMVLVAVIL